MTWTYSSNGLADQHRLARGRLGQEHFSVAANNDCKCCEGADLVDEDQYEPPAPGYFSKGRSFQKYRAP